jgi:excisionase family DNA binding protein
MTLVDPRQLLSVSEAAKRVPQSEIGLRRLIKLGRLPVVRIGRQLFIHADELTAYLMQHPPRSK